MVSAFADVKPRACLVIVEGLVDERIKKTSARGTVGPSPPSADTAQQKHEGKYELSMHHVSSEVSASND